MKRQRNVIGQNLCQSCKPESFDSCQETTWRIKTKPLFKAPHFSGSGYEKLCAQFSVFRENISLFYRGRGNSSRVRTSWMLFPAPFSESASRSVCPSKGTSFNQSQWRLSCARLVPDSEYRGGWQHRGTGTQPAESASQLSVPPARVPAEAGADAHHGDDDDRDHSQSVPRVARLHRADKRGKDEPHDCCGIWKFKFGSHVAAVSSSGSAASESDDAKGERTSGSAQPITEQLYSSRACRMFSFSSYKQA